MQQLSRRLSLISVMLAIGTLLALSAVQAASVTLVINEVDYDQPGTDTGEFVELKNVSDQAIDLSAYSLTFISGEATRVYRMIDLPAVELGAGDYYVICGDAANVPNCDLDLTPNSNLISNSAPAGVALVNGEDVVDALSYEGDLAAPYVEGSGTGLIDNDSAGRSLARCSDGSDSDANNVDFIRASSTPGEANSCPTASQPTATPTESAGASAGDCGDTVTLISAIQGDEATSPIAGTTGVTIEGVVVADFQDGLRGYFVQEEDSDADNDDATSEGIFVFDTLTDVSVGQQVRVRGDVSEFQSSGQTLTELANVDGVTICDDAGTVTPTTIELPIADLADWERYEGMLVTFEQTLTVTDTFTLARFGEVGLSQGGRLFTPTNVVAPGAEANALQAENERRFILLDDANTQQNRDPVPYPLGDLNIANTLRAGYTIGGLTGVLDQRFGTYRLQPTGAVIFSLDNSRFDNETPGERTGSIRVASANVLNYFNGDGTGGGFPTERGADTPIEFERQRDKTIAALSAMDADIIGLMEMENDGYGTDSALHDLVNGLNDATSADEYTFIEPEFSLGTDAIRVALIYRPAVVTPVGDPATLDLGSGRPPLAVTFEEIATGERFTVIVNHFKSKSCTGASGANQDQGDGQGCFNADRVEAANDLMDWLATDPTSSDDSDFLIMGDLNSYAMEDPIQTIINAGYTNLIASFLGEGYSYSFDGAFGYLDHALANPSLTPQVTGVIEWHINADEPTAMDYNMEFKTERLIEVLYRDDPFRMSDHDPVIVDLRLGSEATLPEETEVSEATPEATGPVVEITLIVGPDETSEPTQVAIEPTESGVSEVTPEATSEGTAEVTPEATISAEETATPEVTVEITAFPTAVGTLEVPPIEDVNESEEEDTGSTLLAVIITIAALGLAGLAVFFGTQRRQG